MKDSNLKRLDPNNRITIPARCRKQIGVRLLDPLEFFLDFDRIVLKKKREHCVFCERGGFWDYKGKLICKKCQLHFVEEKQIHF